MARTRLEVRANGPPLKGSREILVTVWGLLKSVPSRGEQDAPLPRSPGSPAGMNRSLPTSLPPPRHCAPRWACPQGPPNSSGATHLSPCLGFHSLAHPSPGKGAPPPRRPPRPKDQRPSQKGCPRPTSPSELLFGSNFHVMRTQGNLIISDAAN